jgi:hypothetical protein
MRGLMTLAAPAPSRPVPWLPALVQQVQRPWVAGLLLWCALVALRLYDMQAFLVTGINDDPDSIVRLLQVRDLLAGQSWFDLTQQRMGEGLPMHWTRLADLLPAALILLLQGFVGTASAEYLAQIMVPLLLLAPAIMLVLAIARNLVGEASLLPAALVMLMGESALTLFNPGTLDHHHLQLIFLLMLLWACTLPPMLRSGLAAGAAIALSFTIGLETVPHIGAVMAVLLLLWIADAQRWQGFLRGLGLALLVASLASALLFMPRPLLWGYCDGWTPPILMFSAALGLLALAASVLGARFAGAMPRAIAATCLCAFVAIGFVTLFPQCLSHPYGTDTLLWHYWLSHITEMKGLVAMMRDVSFAYGYIYIAAVPACIIAAMVLIIRQPPAHRLWLFPLAAVCAGLAVSLFQLRGHALMTASCLPLAAALVTRWRMDGGWQRIACWLLFPAYPYIIACYWLDRPAFAREFTDARQGYCAQAETIAALNQLPPSRLLMPLHAEPKILLNTKHSSIAATYHRNRADNLAMLTAMAASPAEARPIISRLRADYVLMCPGFATDTLIAAEKPASLAAALAVGKPPAWLKPFAFMPHDVALYQVE